MRAIGVEGGLVGRQWAGIPGGRSCNSVGEEVEGMHKTYQ